MSADPHSTLIGNRYVILDQLGHGGMGIVYRATDRLTDQVVALKRVLPVTDTRLDSPDREEILFALTQEFKVLAGLRHPNIISVLDYGFDADGMPYFTMEYLENAKTILKAANASSTAKQVEMVFQLLQALNYLHRYGILHRDLKPENVLTVGGQVKVLDFGLSVWHEHAASSETSGTLAYIAPEILNGDTASPASDLYAVGVIGFEIFAGHHPFYDSSITKLINNIMSVEPEVTVMDVDVVIIEILERLLQKDPRDRYQDAARVIQIITNAQVYSLPAETTAIRESFLQAAPFTGRDAEIKMLVDNLDALATSKGYARLLGGESGVGKSRLIDELRVHALVKGVSVLRGQSIREAGNPFQIWREIVRRLCLMVDLTDFQAAILKPVVPEITRLLDREVPDAPALESGAAQDRLFTTIENLFRACPRPLLILLEDLHWTDNASLLLLVRLTRLTNDRPILFVGTYRDDERPELPTNLHTMEVMTLRRLGKAAVEELAVSMLGEGGRDSRIQTLLQNESGGNVFFLVEVVRALAEQSGQLDKISADELPPKIFAKGIHDILTNRLRLVPPEAQSLLKLAGVMGRQIDLALLKAAEPSVNLDFWLANCSTSAILEVEDAQWRFSHNKLRDGLLDGLSADELRELHRRAALVKEQVYPDGKGHLAGLAQHWEAVGDFARAAGWYQKAGKEAEEAYTPEEAIEYYQKALRYLPENPESRAARIAIYNGLGKMLRWQTRFDEAAEIYQQMRLTAEASNDQIALARALIGSGDVQNSLGNRQAALDYAQQAAEAARGVGKAAEPELADALGGVAWCHYRLKDYEHSRGIAQEALTLSTRLNLQNEMARAQSLLGIVNFMLGDSAAGIQAMEAALKVTYELGDKRDIGIKLNNLGEMHRLLSNYDEAAHYFEEALLIFGEIGYRDAELATLTNLGSVNVERSEYASAEACLRRVIEQTEGDWWGLGETYLSLTRALIGLGKEEEAFTSAQHTLNWSIKAGDQEMSGKAWRILGQLGGQLGVMPVLDGKTSTPAACFQSSLDIFAEDNLERALTLREWAFYEFDQENTQAGNDLLHHARRIFNQLGIDEETV